MTLVHLIFLEDVLPSISSLLLLLRHQLIRAKHIISLWLSPSPSFSCIACKRVRQAEGGVAATTPPLKAASFAIKESAEV